MATTSTSNNVVYPYKSSKTGVKVAALDPSQNTYSYRRRINPSNSFLEHGVVTGIHGLFAMFSVVCGISALTMGMIGLDKANFFVA